MCNFATHSDGDDESKQGFKWSRHSSSWVTNNHLDGPSKGINYLLLVVCVCSKLYIKNRLSTSIELAFLSFLRS